MFSSMNGRASDAQSMPLAGFLGLPHGLVRKAAHFVLFALLGALWYNYVRNNSFFKPTPAFAVTLSLALTVIYAFVDEAHQTFVPGRSGMLSDVLIDSVAGLTGIVIFAIIYYLTRTERQREARRKEIEVLWKRNYAFGQKIKKKLRVKPQKGGEGRAGR